MKKVFFMVGLLAGITTFAQKNITVESDKLLNHDFTKYKTYAFSSMVDSDLEVGFYFLNDLKLKSQIREAIQDEMMGLGYKIQKGTPDLVVNFRVFQEPVTLSGFDGYGTSYWGTNKYRQISDKATYEMKAGTLLVSLLDTKGGQVVWQGFASGLIEGDRFIKDKATIREAVNMVMDKFGVRANSYSVN